MLASLDKKPFFEQLKISLGAVGAGIVISVVILYFSFGGNIYPEDYDSALIQQELLVDAEGNVTLGGTTVVPVCISTRTDRNDYQPVPYAEGTEEYDRVLKKLGMK